MTVLQYVFPAQYCRCVHVNAGGGAISRSGRLRARGQFSRDRTSGSVLVAFAARSTNKSATTVYVRLWARRRLSQRAKKNKRVSLDQSS
jgi:hypothetical protein